MTMLHGARRRGFTIVELVVVIAIVATLICLMVPGVQQARQAARAATCRANLKHIGVALLEYHEAHKVFPPGAIYSSRVEIKGQELLNHTGWLCLLPELGQAPLYNQFDLNLATNGAAKRASRGKQPKVVRGGWPNANSLLVTTILPNLLCPMDPVGDELSVADCPGMWCANHARTNYLFGGGCGGAFRDWSSASRSVVTISDGVGRIRTRGMFGQNGAARIQDVTDGMSYSIAVSESRIRKLASPNFPGREYDYVAPIWGGYRYQGTFVWSATQISPDFKFVGRQHINGFGSDRENEPAYGQTSSVHPGGAHVLMGDGSVRFLANETDRLTYVLLTCIHDDRPTPEF